jgi:hypothetical protein
VQKENHDTDQRIDALRAAWSYMYGVVNIGAVGYDKCLFRHDMTEELGKIKPRNSLSVAIFSRKGMYRQKRVHCDTRYSPRPRGCDQR